MNLFFAVSCGQPFELLVANEIALGKTIQVHLIVLTEVAVRRPLL